MKYLYSYFYLHVKHTATDTLHHQQTQSLSVCLLNNLCTHCDKLQGCFEVCVCMRVSSMQTWQGWCVYLHMFAYVFVHLCVYTQSMINCFICRHLGTSQAVCKPINCPLAWATWLPLVSPGLQSFPNGGEKALGKKHTHTHSRTHFHVCIDDAKTIKPDRMCSEMWDGATWLRYVM